MRMNFSKSLPARLSCTQSRSRSELLNERSSAGELLQQCVERRVRSMMYACFASPVLKILDLAACTHSLHAVIVLQRPLQSGGRSPRQRRPCEADRTARMASGEVQGSVAHRCTAHLALSNA